MSDIIMFYSDTIVDEYRIRPFPPLAHAVANYFSVIVGY
jgi:hypothetical protein